MPGSERKIWHAHPVWFLEGNLIVGYSKLNDCIRLLFWSGQSFDEEGLKKEGSFKAAEARYTSPEQINTTDLKRWLEKAQDVQWDYKNIVKRKGCSGAFEVRRTKPLLETTARAHSGMVQSLAPSEFLPRLCLK